MPSRNRSYSNTSLNEEKAMIQLHGSPGNNSKCNIALDSPAKVSQESIKSSPNRTLTNPIPEPKPTLKPTERRKRTLPDMQISQTQAALFAEYAGLDTVAPEQGKDERYGRVVRDYQLLQDNKEKMRLLIGLIAEENKDVAGIHRRLMLEQVR